MLVSSFHLENTLENSFRWNSEYRWLVCLYPNFSFVHFLFKIGQSDTKECLCILQLFSIVSRVSFNSLSPFFLAFWTSSHAFLNHLRRKLSGHVHSSPLLNCGLLLWPIQMASASNIHVNRGGVQDIGFRKRSKPSYHLVRCQSFPSFSNSFVQNGGIRGCLLAWNTGGSRSEPQFSLDIW